MRSRSTVIARISCIYFYTYLLMELTWVCVALCLRNVVLQVACTNAILPMPQSSRSIAGVKICRVASFVQFFKKENVADWKCNLRTFLAENFVALKFFLCLIRFVRRNYLAKLYAKWILDHMHILHFSEYGLS